MFSVLLSAHEAVLDASGLVDALVAVPVAVGNLVNARLEAVSVVTFVAARKIQKKVCVKARFNYFNKLPSFIQSVRTALSLLVLRLTRRKEAGNPHYLRNDRAGRKPS
jgi:hypothetical protein